MFKEYIAQVMLNAKAMAGALLKKGFTLVSGTAAWRGLIDLHRSQAFNSKVILTFCLFDAVSLFCIFLCSDLATSSKSETLIYP